MIYKAGDIVYTHRKHRWCENNNSADIWHDVSVGEAFVITEYSISNIHLRNVRENYRLYVNDMDRFFSTYDRFASIFTRNFDPQHLQDIEKELIEKFYKKLIKEESKAKQELKKQKKNCKERIDRYKLYRTCEPFLKIQRKQKLNKINEIQEG